jgi:hypothetical protein
MMLENESKIEVDLINDAEPITRQTLPDLLAHGSAGASWENQWK